MSYDFDRIIDRRGTDCAKYDFAVENGYPADVLPLWVADMDFRAPEGVLEALRAAVAHGIFGYSDVKSDYFDAISRWFTRRHGWTPEAGWMVRTPGVVCALAVAVRALTQPGDGVLIQPPVYPPFYSVVKNNHRRLVECPLQLVDGRYIIDFDDFERTVAEQRPKMFILCSPHNPMGRVWTAEELRRVGEICRKYGVFVAADEIHCDFAFDEHPHTVFLKAAPELAGQAMVCTAPSKTFNLAGLQASNIFIPDENARSRFQAEMTGSAIPGPNQLGLIACKAAYNTGEDWLDALRAYLRGNLDCLRDFIAARMPELTLVEPEGTYLAWVDFGGLGMAPEALDALIAQKARLWLDTGRIFGKASAQFQRIVLACPRAALNQALDQLESALRGR